MLEANYDKNCEKRVFWKTSVTKQKKFSEKQEMGVERECLRSIKRKVVEQPRPKDEVEPTRR